MSGTGVRKFRQILRQLRRFGIFWYPNRGRGYQDMEKGLSQTNREILVELNVLRGWIEANRRLIDEVDSEYRRSYYYRPRRRPRGKDKDIVPVPDANE